MIVFPSEVKWTLFDFVIGFILFFNNWFRHLIYSQQISEEKQISVYWIRIGNYGIAMVRIGSGNY
jgi:hypothetical protein